MDIIYTKVTDNLFNVSVNGLEEIVDSALELLTRCDKGIVANEIEGELVDKMVSRIIATDFKNTYPNYLENNSIFVKLIVPFKGKRINITFGEILHGNKIKVLHGVVY